MLPWLPVSMHICIQLNQHAVQCEQGDQGWMNSNEGAVPQTDGHKHTPRLPCYLMARHCHLRALVHEW